MRNLRAKQFVHQRARVHLHAAHVEHGLPRMQLRA